MDRTLDEHIEQQVSEAAAWFDEFKPGWHRRLSLWKLDLERGDNCVGGQLFGSFAFFNYWLHELDKTHLYGVFNPHNDHRRKVERAWKRHTRKRRRADYKSKLIKLYNYVTFHRAGDRG